MRALKGFVLVAVLVGGFGLAWHVGQQKAADTMQTENCTVSRLAGMFEKRLGGWTFQLEPGGRAVYVRYLAPDRYRSIERALWLMSAGDPVSTVSETGRALAAQTVGFCSARW